MIFEITCKACNTTFEVNSERMSTKTEICCPNCEAKFTDAAFQKLKTACATFDEATRDIQQQHIKNSSFPAFGFAIK